MPNINFDGVARRDAREPQITKTQLLEPAHHATSGTGWNTPRSIHGVGDLIANNASWGFDGLDTTQTPSDSPKAPVKQEPTTPAPDHAQNKRQYNSDDEDMEITASRTGENSRDTTDRRGSGTLSNDKFGHESGVIDLTLEDSDDEQDSDMPERRFVPRAEHDSTVSSFPRQKTPSPPRTFTKGLEPIAAHPRKPPIVHRSKPPIKPAGRQRKTISSSPAPASASAIPSISSQRRRLLPAQPSIFPPVITPDRSSTVRTLECTPLGDSTDTMDQTPSQEPDPIQETNTNRSGPFFEEDYSSDDKEEVPAAAPKEKTTRESVKRLLKRLRRDTPTRSGYDAMVEQSRAMRVRAAQRAQEDLATRANTVAPRADNADVDMIDEQAFLGLPHRRGMP
jgi:hypothetical protein